MRLLWIVILSIINMLAAFSVRAQANFTASDTAGCTEFDVKFFIDPASIDLNTITSAKWYFGFGDTVYAADPDTVTFTREGTYSITLIINNDRANPIIKNDYITVHRTLNAYFRHEEFLPNNYFRFIPMDVITNPNATYTYIWRHYSLIGDSLHGIDKSVTILNRSYAIDTSYIDWGTRLVMLTIIDSYGCESSYDYVLRVEQEIEIPNVFVPAVDPFFEINPKDLSTVLNFQVFNRYGMLIFKQEAPYINWDGKTNAGDDLGTGVYFYILKAAQGDPSVKYTKKGFIHLFR